MQLVSPVLQIVPAAGVPPTVPFTDHLKIGSLIPGALAANCTVEAAQTEVLTGEMLTAPEGFEMVTLPELEALGCATLVAVTVTEAEA